MAIWYEQRRRMAQAGKYDETKTIPEQIAQVRTDEIKEQSEIQYKYWLEHAFKPWFASKIAALKAATDGFGTIPNIRMTLPEWEQAAAARAGDMQQHFVQELKRVPMPPTIAADEELAKIFRDSMDEKAQPYRDGAIGGYRHCLEVSTKLRWFDDETRHCEARLNELLPEEYTIAAEITPPVEHELSFVEVPGPILERKKGEDPNTAEVDPMEGIPDTAD